MSYVTTVMLSLGHADCDRLDEFNAYVYEKLSPHYPHYFDLCLLTERVAADYWGGTKYPSANVAGGGLNHLPLDSYLECVSSFPWNDPQSIQVFVKAENADLFAVYNFFELQMHLAENHDR